MMRFKNSHKRTRKLAAGPNRLWLPLAGLCVGANFSEARFYGDPPDAHHPWAVHDENRPQPPAVVPAERPGDPPSDATVLFEGTPESLANWVHEKPDDEREEDWTVQDGALIAAPGAGYLVTREAFGDCQLHIEWSAPTPVAGSGQGRGNSGVFLMGMVEVQVLDNYQNPTYPDGTAGAVYGVMPPAVKPLRPPGEWQSYDIIFRRPILRGGEVLDPGSLTVLCNGVVVQDATPLEGGGGWKRRQPLNRAFPEKGSLKLQDHGNPVRYRNIWIRPLRPRALEGGTDGRLSPEAAFAKRAEIAATIRADAADKEGLSKALRLLESLVYEPNTTARAEADRLLAAYLAEFNSATSRRQVAAEEARIKELDRALTYLIQHNILPDDYFAVSRVNAIALQEGWKKER
jgi:hypothetical protein